LQYTEIVQDRLSPLLSVGIKNFPNEAGYFMLWKLSLTDKDSDQRFIPIFVNENYVLRPMAGKKIMDVFLDEASRLSVRAVPNIAADDYAKLEKMSMDFAYDAFLDLKDKQLRKNKESFEKYMYALKLRTEAAQQIGIENIRKSRIAKLQREKSTIEVNYRKGQQVYPDFRLVALMKLEA
jgi:hypothetical protein